MNFLTINKYIVSLKTSRWCPCSFFFSSSPTIFTVGSFESGPEGDPHMLLVDISTIITLVLHVQVGCQTHETQVSLI